MKLNISKEILIPGFIISLGIIALLAIGFTQIDVIKEMRASVDQLKKDEQELRERYLMLSSLDEKNLEQQAALAELAVPSEKNIPFILQAFRNAVEKNGYLIKEFQFSPGEISKQEVTLDAGKVIEELPLTINLIGPSANLDQLINQLENTVPLFEIIDVDFKVDKDQPNKASLELKLLTFYSPPLAKADIEAVRLEHLVLSEEESALLDKLDTYSRPELIRSTIRDLERKSDNPFVF